jgi:hypothetical protein
LLDLDLVQTRREKALKQSSKNLSGSVENIMRAEGSSRYE